MARPHTWRARLSEIHAAVAASELPAFSAPMLQTLFRVGLRQAKSLLRLMPMQQLGRCVVVVREDLLEFAAALLDTDDVHAHLAALRTQAPRVSRRPVRVYCPEDFVIDEPAPAAPAGPKYRFERGRIELSFGTRLEAEAMLRELSKMVNESGFEDFYCPKPRREKRASSASAQEHGR